MVNKNDEERNLIAKLKDQCNRDDFGNTDSEEYSRLLEEEEEKKKKGKKKGQKTLL